MRLAIVGNCQVDPLRHVLLMANPELSVSCFNINHTRDRHEQEKIASDLSGFDVVFSQVLHENFGDLSSIEMKKKSSNFLSIPNIFFSWLASRYDLSRWRQRSSYWTYRRSPQRYLCSHGGDFPLPQRGSS